MAYQRNRWIQSGQGLGSSFDAPWSKWSWYTDPDLDHAKWLHPKTVCSAPFLLGQMSIYPKRPRSQKAAVKWEGTRTMLVREINEREKDCKQSRFCMYIIFTMAIWRRAMVNPILISCKCFIELTSMIWMHLEVPVCCLSRQYESFLVRKKSLEVYVD